MVGAPAIVPTIIMMNSSESTAEQKYREKKEEKDTLSLAGLLNQLDGVLDTPGRMVVMTTNHPDKLDPALIRPGRIDKTIHLSFMKATEAAQMIKHYFKVELTSQQHHRLEKFLGIAKTDLGTSKGKTAAFVEQRCAEYDTVDEMLEALEGLLKTQAQLLVDSINAIQKSTDTTETANLRSVSNGLASLERQFSSSHSTPTQLGPSPKI